MQQRFNINMPHRFKVRPNQPPPFVLVCECERECVSFCLFVLCLLTLFVFLSYSFPTCPGAQLQNADILRSLRFTAVGYHPPGPAMPMCVCVCVCVAFSFHKSVSSTSVQPFLTSLSLSLSLSLVCSTQDECAQALPVPRVKHVWC